MNSKNQPAELVFAEAMEIADPAARHTYLNRACAGNPSLLEEVESLLAAHEQASQSMTADSLPLVVQSSLYGALRDPYPDFFEFRPHEQKKTQCSLNRRRRGGVGTDYSRMSSKKDHRHTGV